MPQKRTYNYSSEGTGLFDEYDPYSCYDSYSGWKTVPRRPHDRLLDKAYYTKWSCDFERGFQYLADAYNEFVRKEDEAPLRPPPPYR